MLNLNNSWGKYTNRQNEPATLLQATLEMPSHQLAVPQPSMHTLPRIKNNTPGNGVLGDIIDLASQAGSSFVKSNYNISPNSSYNAQHTFGNVIKKFGPWGWLIGTANNAISDVKEAFGLNNSLINKDAAKDAGISGFERITNNIFSTIDPLAIGKKLDSAQRSRESESLRGAYSDTLSDMDTAMDFGSKRLLLGGRKMGRLIEESNRNNDILTKLAITNTQRKNSDYYKDINSQNYKLYNNYQYNSVGKDGIKLLSKEELNKIYLSKKNEVVGIQTNVIPEGALHAHKNNIEDVNSELDEVTKKGIPVIITDDKGDYKQVAEIEKEELVLTKDLTSKIEELWKSGDDDSMLEAGKILAKELSENTKDNTDGDNKD